MKSSLRVWIFFTFMSTSVFADSQTYTVSVVPQMQTTHIQKTWGRFLEELSKKTSLNFELKHYANIPLFEKGLEAGEPDIAFMNPYHAVMAYDWHKYEPIIHDDKKLVGILVVKKDSDIKSLQDLQNKTLAFPSPNAFAASLYMRALLEVQEKISFKPVYVKTHSNVYRNVLFNTYPAGGGVNNTLQREPASVSSQLKVLYTTKKTAPHPLCVHPRVSKEMRDKIQNTILAMSKEPQYKVILHEIQIPHPLSTSYDKEYKSLKKLNLEKYLAK